MRRPVKCGGCGESVLRADQVGMAHVYIKRKGGLKIELREAKETGDSEKKPESHCMGGMNGESLMGWEEWT